MVDAISISRLLLPFFMIVYCFIAIYLLFTVLSKDTVYYASEENIGIKKRTEFYTILTYSAVCGLSLLCINAYLSVKVSDVYSFESYMLIFYSVWIFVTFLITLHPSLVSSNKPIKTSIVSIIENNRKNVEDYKVNCKNKDSSNIYKVNNCDVFADKMHDTLDKLNDISSNSNERLDSYSGTLMDAMSKVDTITILNSTNLIDKQQASIDSYNMNLTSSMLHYICGFISVAGYLRVFNTFKIN